MNENDEIDRVLNEILEPWGFTTADVELDTDGDLFWVLDNDNGYYVTVYVGRRIVEPKNSIIRIVTAEL